MDLDTQRPRTDETLVTGTYLILPVWWKASPEFNYSKYSEISEPEQMSKYCNSVHFNNYLNVSLKIKTIKQIQPQTSERSSNLSSQRGQKQLCRQIESEAEVDYHQPSTSSCQRCLLTGYTFKTDPLSHRLICLFHRFPTNCGVYFLSMFTRQTFIPNPLNSSTESL